MLVLLNCRFQQFVVEVSGDKFPFAVKVAGIDYELMQGYGQYLVDHLGFLVDGGILRILYDEGPKLFESDAADDGDGLVEAVQAKQMRFEVGVEVVGSQPFYLILQVFVAGSARDVYVGSELQPFALSFDRWEHLESVQPDGLADPVELSVGADVSDKRGLEVSFDFALVELEGGLLSAGE